MAVHYGPMNLTPFSVLLSRVQASAGAVVLDVPEDWLQGRTLFGGMQGVVGLAAMRTVAPAAPLRSMQVTFLAPVPGGPVRAVVAGAVGRPELSPPGRGGTRRASDGACRAHERRGDG